MVIFTVRRDRSVLLESVADQQVLLRERLAGAGWEMSAILEAMPQAKTFYFDAVSQIQMPAWTRGRVALVGDAAASPSLLAGQGSALAMVESYTLAAELAHCHDHRQAFASYQQRLAALLRSKQDAATGLGLAFAPRSRLQLTVRNTAMRLMGLPKVADLVMGRSFRDTVKLPTFTAA
jgi:2-polyprenyl-6-methoxyphenol hydroxylase-like FAD-dependent oxidoreductase